MKMEIILSHFKKKSRQIWQWKNTQSIWESAQDHFLILLQFWLPNSLR